MEGRAVPDDVPDISVGESSADDKATCPTSQSNWSPVNGGALGRGRNLINAAAITDKLLAKMEERDADILLDDDEECVVCLGARATMQTFPCEHRVVCRKCFIRTIQVAVSQRSLPLRCVVCRTRILKLRHAASGASPVSVSTHSPFHSSSAPPRINPQLVPHHSHHHEGFVVHSGSSSNSSSTSSSSSLIRTSKLHAVTSLGKIAPCSRGSARDLKTSSPPFFVPDPPRVTLTSAAAPPRQFSPLIRSRQCHGGPEASGSGGRVAASVKKSKSAASKASATSTKGVHPVTTGDETGHRPQQTQCSPDWRRKD
ncbi:hypothetical protein ACOMHN_006054 [Nucella lapillus]